MKRNGIYWQALALALLALSLLVNAALIVQLTSREERHQVDAARYKEQVEQAEHTRDLALDDLEKMTIQVEQEQQPVVAQAATFEVVDAYQYIGECTITSYCPCAVCCGHWADGLTATGIPAVPGIVAVDPEVIPLGSVVVIGGQRYLAADTGVTGLHVDICTAEHQEAEDFGVQTMSVWIETEEE